MSSVKYSCHAVSSMKDPPVNSPSRYRRVDWLAVIAVTTSSVAWPPLPLATALAVSISAACSLAPGPSTATTGTRRSSTICNMTTPVAIVGLAHPPAKRMRVNPVSSSALNSKASTSSPGVNSETFPESIAHASRTCVLSKT